VIEMAVPPIIDAATFAVSGSKSLFLQTLVASPSAKTAGFGVPSLAPKWRAAADEDGHYCFAVAL
jgi:hypothetical protein